MKCSRCNLEAVRLQGHQWLCPKHYRFGQIRSTAKRRQKAVPSHEWLEKNVPAGMMCGYCKRKMNWLSKEGSSTVITFQHDRNGEFGFLCLACNVRHAAQKGDSFYSIPNDKKRCANCDRALPLSEFSKDNSKRWNNRNTYCRKCRTQKHKEWVSKNREALNAKRREYYHARKASGNPIPR